MGYVAELSVQRKKRGDGDGDGDRRLWGILPPGFAVTSSHTNLAGFVPQPLTPELHKGRLELEESLDHKDAFLLTGISLATKTRVTILRLSKSRSAETSDSILG